MNKRFKDTFSSEWVKYVVVIVLSVAIWIAAFGLYHAPKPYEKIELFFAGKVKDYSFSGVAEKSFDGIKKVEISSIGPSENTFYHKYSENHILFIGSVVFLCPNFSRNGFLHDVCKVVIICHN